MSAMTVNYHLDVDDELVIKHETKGGETGPLPWVCFEIGDVRLFFRDAAQLLDLGVHAITAAGDLLKAEHDARVLEKALNG